MTKCVGSRAGLGKCAESERAVGLGTKAGYATSAEASRDAQLGTRKNGKLYALVGGLVKKSAINCKTTTQSEGVDGTGCHRHVQLNGLPIIDIMSTELRRFHLTNQGRSEE